MFIRYSDISKAIQQKENFLQNPSIHTYQGDMKND
jgi:hypothetical protein